MSSTAVADTLTVIEHATWIVDNAYITDKPSVDDNGVVTPVVDSQPPRLAVDVITERIRVDPRGVLRKGLTVRLFMILLITAAWHGRVYVKDLHTIATGIMPRELQWELGVLRWENHKGKPVVRKLTRKQLYDLAACIRLHLDVDPEFDLTDEQRQERIALMEAIADAFVYATHVLALTGTAVAVDESGVWSYLRGKRKPEDLPLVDPADEDPELAAANRKKVEDKAAAAVGSEEALDEHEALAAAVSELSGDHSDDGVHDEDFDPDAAAADVPVESLEDASDSGTEDGEMPGGDKPKKRGKRCWLNRWGVKTAKTGKRSAYFGYALHVFVRVPMPSSINSKVKASKKERYAEPLLIEEFSVTAASTDIVDTTLALVRKRIARGAPVQDLIGDRHYSYKKFDRWASKLWQMKVRPVLDLREDDHGATYYEGAIILAGTPHLDPPEHLRKLPRPGKGASRKEREEFEAQIAERQKYAFKRHKTAWSRNDGKPGGDGKTRWVSPVMAGTVGCPHLPESVKAANAAGLPILDPAKHNEEVCVGATLLVPPGPHMKYQQEHYWGSTEWLLSWNRRTYVEGVFGNMKNFATGNIHRGYMQFTGFALVTLGITAAVVAYNLRELETWYIRASQHCPDNLMLTAYEEHPLHQPTKWVFGFSMLTEEQQAEVDARHQPSGPCQQEGVQEDAA